MRISVLIPFLLFLVSCDSNDESPKKAFVFEGTVLDDGVPVPNIKLKIRLWTWPRGGYSASYTAFVETNTNGLYHIDVPYDTTFDGRMYSIQVEKEGYIRSYCDKFPCCDGYLCEKDYSYISNQNINQDIISISTASYIKLHLDKVTNSTDSIEVGYTTSLGIRSFSSVDFYNPDTTIYVSLPFRYVDNYKVRYALYKSDTEKYENEIPVSLFEKDTTSITIEY
jgi:hypothetical protein